MEALWLATDPRGCVGLFVCEETSTRRRGRRRDPFDVAARVAAALVVRDASVAPAPDDGADRERVLVVVDRSGPGVDYRSRAELLSVEEQLPGAQWTVVIEGNPRALISGRALGRAEREQLRARADCVLVAGEQQVVAAAKRGELFVFHEAGEMYARADRDVPRPLRADEVRDVELVPLEASFSASHVVWVAPEDAAPAEKPFAWRAVGSDGLESLLAAVGCLPAVLFGALAFFGLVALLVSVVSAADPSLAAVAFTLLGLTVLTVLLGLVVRAWLRQPIAKARVRVSAPRPQVRVAPAERESAEEESADDERRGAGRRR